MKTIGKTIIVKPVWTKRVGQGKIILPIVEGARHKYIGDFYGVVVAVGKRSEFRNDLKVGDKIWFRRHEGKSFHYGGEEYLLLKDRWVHALLI